ncbi:MAG: hypothetical protein AAGA46_03245 [Cyanobacteria bacterium P01_F01_bin.13]
MTLASRLAAANIDRTTQRQNLESLSPEQPGIISGVPVSEDATGITLETENDGRIKVYRENDAPEGITPSQGRQYQLSVNGTSARLQVNSRGQAQQQPSIPAKQIIVSDRAPTIDDKGRTDLPWWIDVTPAPANGLFSADLYVWTGVVDGYAKISGGGNTITFGDGPPSDGFTGTPTAGTQYWDNFVDRKWLYTAANEWKPEAKLSLTVPPSSAVTDSLVVGDQLLLGEYSWYWDGTDWEKNHCCENGPDSPPPSSICPEGWSWGPDCPEAEPGDFCSPVGENWTCGCPSIGICP